ncbi:MAG TPA: hypothetical protein VNC50_11620 [Planctomycetia bacterium]|nr:hypothetical protein [Planctomycetia bacterium]
MAASLSAIVYHLPLPGGVPTIVGLPLLRGYSETSESLLWLSFLTFAALFAAPAFRIAIKYPLTAILWPLLAVAAFWNGALTGGVLLGAVIIGLAVVLAIPSLMVRRAFLILAWTVPFFFVILEVPMVGAWQQASLFGAWLMLSAGILRASRAGAWLSLATAALTFQLIAPSFSSAGAAAAIAALATFPATPPARRAARVAAGIPISFWIALEANWRSFHPLQAGAVFAAEVASLALFFDLARPRISAAFARIRTDLRRDDAIAFLALVSLAPFKPWLALAAGAPMLLLALRPQRDRRLPFQLATIALASTFILPGAQPPRNSHDPFHDGQLVSAAWEWESGRPLYAEVVPLRTWEFWVTVVVRRYVGDGPTAYAFGQDQLGFFLPGAVCALVIAVSRSARWGLAAALAALHLPACDGRQGALLLAAAIAAAAFRTRMHWRTLFLALAGLGAGFVGFDAFGAIALGATIAGLVAGGLPGGLVSGLSVVLPWTVLLGLWQGAASAREYHLLLVDYVRHYSAVYGLPIPWTESHHHRAIFSTAALFGLWFAWGALAGPGWRRSLRSAWWLLSGVLMLFGQRLVGRSDGSHLCAGTYPSLVCAVLLGWSWARALAPPSLSRRLALAAIAIAALSAPRGSVAPTDAWRNVRAAAADPAPWPAAEPAIVSKVPPDGWFWDTEDGLSNFIARRHNPTRHAIPYCMPSIAEHRRAVADLMRRPPALVRWQFASKTDHMQNPLRYYAVADYLYRRYRPALIAGGQAYLEPAPPNWGRESAIDPLFLGPIDAGWLPARWGDAPLPFRRAAGPEVEFGEAGKAWIWSAPIDPSRWNALEIESESAAGGVAELRLRHRDARGEIVRDDLTPFRWRLAAGRRRYLVPIGCNPGWSWRREIAAIELVGPAAFRIESAALVILDYQTPPAAPKSVRAEQPLLDRLPEARGGRHH